MQQEETTNEGVARQQREDDARLFQLLRSGDKAAMVRFYRRYASLVYGLALTIVKSPEEAEDLTQEIFVSLWNRGGYNPERSSLSSYLILLTRSRALDRLRSRGRKSKLNERFAQMQILEPSNVTPLEYASLEECARSVREALDTLPPAERQVLELSFFSGFTYSQIAEQTGTPLGTVKRWARKAMNGLKQALQPFIE